ncbi:MAG: tRNA 2-thiouridine(34) synthase MnmA [Candidatus Neomarinimicrobiota bacterium]
MTPIKNRVVVAMSGGVDSSVALLRLVEEGYEAIGVTLKLWEYDGRNGSYCCSVEAINNAKIVCQSLGVPHYTLDYRNVFRENVVNYLVGEYFSGRTPNPCIRCNSRVRWGELFRHADLLRAHWMATGHYAQMDCSDAGRPVVKKGIDDRKDQSYVLWGIPTEALKRTLFPVGALTKEQVRRLAKEAGFVTAEIAESQEICFIPNDDYREFLTEFDPERSSREESGEFVLLGGETLGSHHGISKYTIGQRRGLGVTGPEAVYVQSIDSVTKKIVLAPRKEMFFDGCSVGELNWLQDPWERREIHVQIRYNHSGVSCRVQRSDNGTVTAEFESPQFAVTPGQSAVFYSHDELLGGGIIQEGHIHG